MKLRKTTVAVGTVFINVEGRFSSIIPISLANRFTILPVGLVSKNRTGTLRIAVTIWQWMLEDDEMADCKMEKLARKFKTNVAETKPM